MKTRSSNQWSPSAVAARGVKQIMQMLRQQKAARQRAEKKSSRSSSPGEVMSFAA
jgi:RNA 3'-terminal phosphate cyclase